ncbi:MAG: hypothetical protein FJ011_09555 [Chloroflexi bacterium]|nr:hypothetical protein [Chloroflexota bacterium]
MTILQDLITELHILDRELARYEEKYGLLSETFLAWYQSGEEPDDPAWVQDFALWAGAYQLKLRRQEKYRRLVSESLARHVAPALIRQALPVGTPA